ncbi:MAG: hypothetical protein ALAOOOJD_04369 [bacterium]|nr:hypothetical protein [bacterium]
MRDKPVNSQKGRVRCPFLTLLLVVVSLYGCPDPPDPPRNFSGKLPPPVAFSAAEFANAYEGYTVLIASFDSGSESDAYYLAGQLRAAQVKSFILRRENDQLDVCVGNYKSQRQAKHIRDYLNQRYELQATVLAPERFEQE